MSTEHSISCISASAIMGELPAEKFEVIPIGITRAGTWVEGVVDPKGDAELPEVPEGREVALSVNPQSRGEITDVATGEVLAVADVVFPILHGPFGEDGTIQGLFELSGIPYVGSGQFASAACMDKEYTKKLASLAGVPITREVIFKEERTLNDEEKAHLGLPVFVKPARGGSSIGVSKVDSWDEFDAAIAKAFESDTKAVVEAGLVGDEVEIGVMELPGGELITSPIAKLNGTTDSAEGFYGFETKYLDNVVTSTIPAGYDEATTREVERLAKLTFRALECRGLARVDFFITESGPVLNEPNTMPGFTPISQYPQMFIAGGMTYGQILETLIDTALSMTRR
ncbi:D-alanine--D-alanine ligase family protein [Corynebacterium aquatimens]